MKFFILISFLYFFSITAVLAEKMDIQARSLEIYQDKGYAVFLKDVEAKQGEMTIFSQKLEIFFNKKDAGKNETGDIDKIIAKQKVIIKYKKDVAKGNKATYNPISNEILLTGNVVFIRDKNVLKGDNLIYNVKTGKTKLTSNKGRIKAQLVPNKGK